MPSDDAIIALIKDSFLFSCVENFAFQRRAFKKGQISFDR